MLKTIGHYEILEELGEGGMGRVYLARDPRLERRVAIKVLAERLASDLEWLARFRREARAVAALNHPNIVTLFTVEEADGLHFLTMEPVAGKGLDQLIPTAGMTLEDLLPVAEQLADALAAAHEGGITHRDLKPENVMVTAEGRIKVLDFGLAKLLADDQRRAAELPEQGAALTREGMVMGSFPYMSPEQAKGEPVDHRSDLFSLGIVLYELVTGERPFQGKSTAELISSILLQTPTPVSQVAPGCPPELAGLIGQCLEKDLGRRAKSASEVRDRLRALREERHLAQALARREASGSRPPASGSAPAPPPVPEPASGLDTRRGVFLLLALVFAVNWGETWIETWLRDVHGVGRELGFRIAAAVHELEGGRGLEHQDPTNAVAVYGGSISYFFLPVLLGVAVLVDLARRRRITPLRVFVLAVAIAYGLSLPFYLFFPLPERWAYPPSETILLSDLWSSRLIETLRPISGIDNCFPSFHVSFSVILALAAYLYRIRLRTVVLALGATIVLATFLLGIHWLPDIVAGLAVGVLGMALARRIDRRLEPHSTRVGRGWARQPSSGAG